MFFFLALLTHFTLDVLSIAYVCLFVASSIQTTSIVVLIYVYISLFMQLDSRLALAHSMFCTFTHEFHFATNTTTYYSLRIFTRHILSRSLSLSLWHSHALALFVHTMPLFGIHWHFDTHIQWWICYLRNVISMRWTNDDDWDRRNATTVDGKAVTIIDNEMRYNFFHQILRFYYVFQSISSIFNHFSPKFSIHLMKIPLLMT